MQHGGTKELRDPLTNNTLWMQVVPLASPLSGKPFFLLQELLSKWMIKVVSADIWRIEHGRRAKNGGLCDGPKRRFRAYPLLDNASCLLSVVIGGRVWVYDVQQGHCTCRDVLPEGLLTVQQKHGEQGRTGLARVPIQRLKPFVAVVVIDRHRVPRLWLLRHYHLPIGILRTTTSTMPIRSGHLWHNVLLRTPVALLHCQVIEMTKNIHFITNISLEDQLAINLYFSDVWLNMCRSFH